MQQKEIFIHELKLPEKDDFSARFNQVSDLFAIAQKEDTKEAWDEYHSAKYCLEQGLPIALPLKINTND